MTKSVVSEENIVPVSTREPRPFLFLEPRRAAATQVDFSAKEVELLDSLASPSVPVLVRSLVSFTIALQNRRALEHRNVQPIQVSVLNRRRRAARSWLVAILAGKVDAATCHAVATQWLPTLCGTGPDIARCIPQATSIIEFVRGGMTATLFDTPADNLVPNAKALHVLESVLSAHYAAVRDASRSTEPIRS